MGFRSRQFLDVSLGSAEKWHCSVFEAELQDVIPICHATIAGTRIVGRLTAGYVELFRSLSRRRLGKGVGYSLFLLDGLHDRIATGGDFGIETERKADYVFFASIAIGRVC
jgi:hypothetical protein